MARKFTEFYIALLILVFVVLIAPVHAQTTGEIRGVVTDEITNETLIGVNLRIDGTSLGTATNASGEYIIRSVPAGNHILVITYLGYQRIEHEINIQAGETLELDFDMSQEALEGAEIVVTTQARGQRSAINEQISSRTITNVVSADKIRELPDDNAATALSRLPGISLQDGDKVVVRGMQAKMNQVMVNGIALPSTDMNDRSTNLGFISSNMLSGIEVTKAVTPDMDANSIGGTVNLRLQEAPEDFRADVMTQGAYNTQDQTYENYKTWASVSNRFLNNKLGVFIQGNARRFDGGSEFASADWIRLNPGADPGYGLASYGMNEFEYGDNIRLTNEYGGSMILDYDLPNGKLVLQNTYANTLLDNELHFERYMLGTGRREFRSERDIHTVHLIINALQGEQDFGLFDINYGISHAYTSKETDLMYSVDFPGTAAFSQLSETRRRTFTPDSVHNIVVNEDHWENQTVGNGSTRDEHFSERQLVGNLNVTFPLTISSNISGEIQTGGKIAYTARENDVMRHFARLSEAGNNVEASEFLTSIGQNPGSALRYDNFRDPNYETGRGSYFLGGLYDMRNVIRSEYMDQYMRLAPSGWGSAHLPDSRRFDYIADETLSAGYLMADFNLGARLTLLAGVRYEHFHMDYEGSFVQQTHFAGNGQTDQTNPALDTLNTAKKSIDHWFPNVQLRYNVTDWFDVRLAYTKTLSRPDYSQLLPSIFVDQDGRAGEAGNPLLLPAVSTNYDSYLSFYTNKIGLFTVGGFYKEIDNVILSNSFQRRNLPENVVWPDEESGLPNINPSNLVSTYNNNPNPAHVYGIELEWQSNFWYLPRPFDSMVLNVNYTRVWSEMDYRQIRNISDGNPLNPTLVQVDTVRTARLIHQGDHTINVALGADYRGFSGRVSFRLQDDVITSVASRPEEDQFTGKIYGWDFTIRQRLPMDGLSFFANGMNITHSPTSNYQEFRREADGEILTNLSRITYNPRRFELGVRYTF